MVKPSLLGLSGSRLWPWLQQLCLSPDLVLALLSNLQQSLKLVWWLTVAECLNISDVNLGKWICLINSVNKHILNILCSLVACHYLQRIQFKGCFWKCALGPISGTWLWVTKIDNSLHSKSLWSQFITPEKEPLEACDSFQLLEQNCGPEVSPKWMMEEVLWFLSRTLPKSL